VRPTTTEVVAAVQAGDHHVGPGDRAEDAADVWLMLLASLYLFVQVLSKPVHALTQDGVFGFWPAVDLAAAGVVSFAPLAADYTRHSRTNKAAFAGSALGYGLAAVLYYALGVVAVATLQTNSTDVITALVTLPAGAIALFVLLVDEVDEAYANVYSTMMAAHNLIGHIDRRWISVVIGVIPPRSQCWLTWATTRSSST
jgi:nucleobase:cation symporter-1, NCS1 family